ncbi:MAG: sugar ABC transporter ATP-binding protein [Actinomycetota bacterium]
MLEFRGIIKSFPGQVAVDDVSFSVHPGEIHGLVGENGAGKSTLVKVLAGEFPADAGDIRLEGEPFQSNHPSEATQKGIGFIHQVPALVPVLSVGENLSLGLHFARSRVGLISWGKQHRSARTVLRRVGLGHVDPSWRLEELSLAERQLVALARILTIESLRVVVLDEVTAPLTEHEVERLFDIVREIQSQGVGVIYISHRLEEIFELTDRVTVMKDGAGVATRDTASLDPKTLSRLIIGKDPVELFEAPPVRTGETAVVSVQGVSDEVLHDVSLELHEGEVLGIAGLGGSGRTELVEVIFGARQPAVGRLLLEGQEVRFRHPADAVARGVGLVPEDRHAMGFLGGAPIWQNVTLPWLSRFKRAGILSLGREREAAEDAVERFDIRARSIGMPMRELSGGNQQKTILAKWLTGPLKVLLLDEPTHGVDVGAKEEIYRLIRRLAAEGVSIIVISSELEELEGLCTRVLLLVEGRIVGELVGEDITEANMLGVLYAEHDDGDQARTEG